MTYEESPKKSSRGLTWVEESKTEVEERGNEAAYNEFWVPSGSTEKRFWKEVDILYKAARKSRLQFCNCVSFVEKIK